MELYQPPNKPSLPGAYQDSSFITLHTPYELSFFLDEGRHPGKRFWTCGVFDIVHAPTDAELDELRANGWEPWTEQTRVFFFPVQLQLGQTLIVEPFDYWARTVDREHAQRYPVLLTYQTLNNEKHLSSVPPDMSFGTCALIADDLAANELTFHLYTCDQLGQRGEQLCTQIKSGMLVPLIDDDISWKDKYILAQKRRALWEETHQAAQALARLYWHLHQKTLHLPESRNLPDKLHQLKIPTMITMPPVVHGVLTAYSNAQSGANGWRRDNQLFTYQYQKDRDLAQVQLRPRDAEIVDESMLKSLWKRIRSISDVDGDVFLCLLAQWMAAERDGQGFVWITAEQILSYRGIQPRMQHVIPHDKTSPRRRAGHRQEDLAQIAESMSRIRDTHVSVRQWIKDIPMGKRGRGRLRKRLLQQASYLVAIADTILQQEIEFDSAGETALTADPSLAIAWRYQPGGWQEAFVEGPNRQMAWLIQQALNYDPYHEMFEKRLARYLMFHLSMHSAGATITRKIRDMLDELSLPINWNDPEKTRTRFEKAMKRLQDDRQITEWAYAGEHGQLPRRHWLDTWLDYEISVSAAPLSTPEMGDEHDHIPERTAAK